MKKKLFVFVAFIALAFGAFISNADGTTVIKDQFASDDLECKWATRETSAGWEAICISTGVGYSCTCGSVKNY